MLFRKYLHAGSKELLYILLFTISIVLVVWQYFGMSIQVDVIKGISPSMQPRVHSDLINGGKSRTSLSTRTGEVIIDCDIVLSDTFAFCGVEIPLVETGKPGIDMRKYNKVEVELEYLSEHNDTLLVYLMNEIPLDGGVHYKSNLWPVSPDAGNNIFSLSSDKFFVPSWWIYQNSMNIEDVEPDIRNVTSLQITTGDNTDARSISLKIKRITFLGKWVSADDLYFFLLAAWLFLFSFHVTTAVRVLSDRFSETKKQNRKLLDLNRFLSIQKDQFETMAKTDKLTGALNRAGVRDDLQSVLKDYKNKAIPCALLAIDVDNFKEINDDYGHSTGDAVLKALVKLINSHTRQLDTFARWGGEEFILICPNTDIHAATNLAEILRSKIESAELIKERTITCSFGVATLQSDDIKAWFKRADEALYEAKKSGRNRVVHLQD